MCLTLVVSAPGRQRQEDCCKFKASLVYIASSRPSRAPVTKRKERKKEKRLRCGDFEASLGYIRPCFRNNMFI